MADEAQGIFISHIHEEAALGNVLKEWIEDAFRAHGLKAFLSSDKGDLPAGRKWLDVIDEALQRADMVISLISPTSITRPWINIELGAGWSKNIPVIPVCHSGQLFRDLPRPFQDFNGIDISSTDSAERLISGIANVLQLTYSRKLHFADFHQQLLSAAKKSADTTKPIVTITSPHEADAIAGTCNVTGTIAGALPTGHVLRAIRGAPKSGGFVPNGVVDLDADSHQWRVHEFDIGGQPGDLRTIEIWVVGPDGQAFLNYWEEAHKVHYETNQIVQQKTGAFGKWLPFIKNPTRDMQRLARVEVSRK